MTKRSSREVADLQQGAKKAAKVHSTAPESERGKRRQKRDLQAKPEKQTTAKTQSESEPRKDEPATKAPKTLKPQAARSSAVSRERSTKKPTNPPLKPVEPEKARAKRKKEDAQIPKSPARPKAEAMLRIHPTMMTLKVIALNKEMELPPAEVTVHPDFSLATLRELIFSKCPILVPSCQSFFRKVPGGSFKRLDAVVRNRKTLREAGFDLPGPHEIYLDIDVAEMKKQNAAAPLANGGPSASAGVGPSEAPDGGNDVEAVQEGPTDASRHTPALVQHHIRSPDRRPINKWTDEETDALVAGVSMFGLSKWTLIASHWDFHGRTTVDLKDKWRNLVKNVREGKIPRGSDLSLEIRNRIREVLEKQTSTTNPPPSPIHPGAIVEA